MSLVKDSMLFVLLTDNDEWFFEVTYRNGLVVIRENGKT